MELVLIDKTGKNCPEISALDSRNHIHPWHSINVDESAYMVASRAEGIFIYDEKR